MLMFPLVSLTTVFAGDDLWYRMFGGLMVGASALMVWRFATTSLIWDESGIMVRNLFRTHRIPWADVRDIRVGAPSTEFSARVAIIETATRRISADSTVTTARTKPPRDAARRSVDLLQAELEKHRSG